MISFVGAGPGAPDLLTLRAAQRLQDATTVVWASSLVPEAVLDHCRPDAEIHDSAGMTFEDVAAVYTAHAGEPIVRLHSGDISIYSSLQEQIDWCLANGQDYEIVPGVGSLAAASAAVGRELTVPGAAQSLVSTRLAGRTAASVPEHESFEAMAALGSTMAVYLSGARPDELQRELLAGAYDEDTPAAVVVRVSWPDEQVVMTTLGGLAEAVRTTGARTVVLVLVGETLRGAAPRCHLYDPSYAHGYRRRSAPGTTVGRPR